MVEPLRLRPARGGFLRPFGCGQFIKEFLLGRGPYDSPGIDPNRGAPTEDMVALAMEKGLELSFEEAWRRIPHRLTKVRSHSFYRYFHHVKMLGWVEPTGEEEGSLFGSMPGAKVEGTPEGTTLVEVPQPRRLCPLTAKGKEAPDVAWGDPLQPIYNYTREERSPRKAERLNCPGQQRPDYAKSTVRQNKAK